VLEYELAKDLDHPHIVKYEALALERVQQHDVYNLVMELIEGKNMHEYLKDVGAPKLSQLPYVQNIGR
jgi:serine/threonine protein kinase